MAPRAGVSEQIRHAPVQSGALPVHIVVDRANLLEGLCDGLAQPEDSLRHGLDVQFRGTGEVRGGDGHRREVFKLAPEELTNARSEPN